MGHAIVNTRSMTSAVHCDKLLYSLCQAISFTDDGRTTIPLVRMKIYVLIRRELGELFE